MLITFWENLEAIKNFAGEDYEKAKYYPEDKDFCWNLRRRRSITRCLRSCSKRAIM